MKFDPDKVHQQPLSEVEAKKQKFLTDFFKSLYKYSDDEPDQFIATLAAAAAHITFLIDNHMVMDEYKDDEILRQLFLMNFEHAYKDLNGQKEAHQELQKAMEEKFDAIVSDIESKQATKQ